MGFRKYGSPRLGKPKKRRGERNKNKKNKAKDNTSDVPFVNQIDPTKDNLTSPAPALVQDSLKDGDLHLSRKPEKRRGERNRYKKNKDKDITSDVPFINQFDPTKDNLTSPAPALVQDSLNDGDLNPSSKPMKRRGERNKYKKNKDITSDVPFVNQIDPTKDNLTSSAPALVQDSLSDGDLNPSSKPKKRRERKKYAKTKVKDIASDVSFVNQFDPTKDNPTSPAPAVVQDSSSDGDLNLSSDCSMSPEYAESESDRSFEGEISLRPGIPLLDGCDISNGDTSRDDNTKDDSRDDNTKDDSRDDNAKDDIRDDNAKDDIRDDNAKYDNTKDDSSNDGIPSEDDHASFLTNEHSYCKTSCGSFPEVIDDHNYCAPDTESEMDNDHTFWAHPDDLLIPIGQDVTIETSDVTMPNSESSNVEDKPSSKPYGPEFPPEYCELRDTIPQDWCPGQFDIMRKSAMIQFFEFYEGDPLIVKMSVKVSPDYLVTIRVHGQEIRADHIIWECIPRYASTKDTIFKVLLELSKLHVCGGNPDTEFTKLLPPGAGLSDRPSQEPAAFHETGFDTDCIRSTVCDLLIRKTLGSRAIRCRKCQLYRNTLRKRKWREEHRPSIPSKHTGNQKLRHHELCEKASKLQAEKTVLRKEVEILRRKLSAKIETEGQKMDPIQTAELTQLMEDCGDEINEKLETDSFKRLFWEQQLKAAKAGGKSKGMRWHPMIIKWCLYLKSRSAKAYDIMRETGFIELPSKRTLFDYSKYIRAGHGLTAPILKHLKEECHLKGLYNEPFKQYVGILQDEVKIKEDIVYDKHTGDLVGYVDLDDIANQLNNINPDQNQQSIAKYLLVVMVQGIASNLRYPLACFATNGITSAFLMPIIWNCIEHIELICELKVMFITCDGASSNRRFFRLHRVNQQDEVLHYTENPFSTDEEPRKIWFISCVPHLLKTLRNNFSNSQSHNNTKLLMKNHKVISWMHIVRLFEEHCENNLYAICKKLRRDHVDLTPFARMKVNLAAQVMSNTVATALEQLYGDETTETVKFIRMVNRFFDCCNTRSQGEALRTRNPDMAVYDSVNDPRLEWLKDDFLSYFDDWKQEIEREMRGYSAHEKAMKQISYQTLEGVYISVNSIVDLTKYCLNHGVPFVRTAIFNQDNLEAHFSHYRHKGGANDNPTAYEAMHVLANLRTTESQALAPVRANIRGNVLRQVIDNTPLPRRPNAR